MVKAKESAVPPAVEKFSDAALAPSQAFSIRRAFEKSIMQNGESSTITVDAAVRLLQNLGASRDLPLQWSSLSHEDFRAFVVKFVDDAEARTVAWDKLVESLPVAGGEEHGAALKMQNILRQKRARERVEEQRALKAA